MIGKTVLNYGKKAKGDNSRSVYRAVISTEHTLLQDTIDIPHLKSFIVWYGRKLAFQLRSEEWLTSTVVVKNTLC
jgi:DNA polymerase-4